MIPQAPFIQRCLWYNFSLPQLKGFREPRNLCPCKATGTLSAHWGTSNGIVTALSSRSHQAWGDERKDKSQTRLWVSRSSLDATRYICSALEVKEDFQMENNLWFWASLLKSEVGRFLWLHLSEQWQGLGAAPQLSAFPGRGTEVSNNHWMIVGGSGSPELQKIPHNLSGKLHGEGGGPVLTRAPWKVGVFQLSLQRMGHSDDPLFPEEKLQLSFSLHVSWMEFILPGTSQISSGTWDTQFRARTWGGSCPIPAACTSITILAVPYPPPLPFWVLVTRSWHNFPDDTLVRNDTFLSLAVNKSVCWWRRKKSPFRLFCFPPRQESSFCLCPLAQGPWLLWHKKPISTNKNYFFGPAVYWHLNYNVVTFFSVIDV